MHVNSIRSLLQASASLGQKRFFLEGGEGGRGTVRFLSQFRPHQFHPTFSCAVG